MTGDLHLLFTFCQKVKMILWSIQTVWYQGLAKTMNNDKFKKSPLTLKNSSPDSKADFSQRLLFGIWSLILIRYDIKCYRIVLYAVPYSTQYRIVGRYYFRLFHAILNKKKASILKK